MKYEEVLDRAIKNLPQKAEKAERFEIPKVKGHIQGNKTVIINFNQICDVFGREPAHLLKFLQRELATPASIDGPRLVLGRKIGSGLINQKVEQYANTFVICSECGKPDTQLKREEKVLTMKCTACGAKHTVKAKI